MQGARDKGLGVRARNIIILLFLCFMSCSLSFDSFAAVVATNPIPNKITKSVIRFLAAKDPIYASKRIEVTYKYADRTFAGLKARGGDITFEVIELYPDFKPVGNIIIPVQVYQDGQEKEKLFLRTTVSVFDYIVVARKRLMRGDIISTFEAGLDERDVASLNPDVIRSMDLAMGNPIYEHMIKDKPIIKKNDKVRMTLTNGGITASADGTALQDGNIGDTIKVRNMSSGKDLSGVISASGEVDIK
jgi:flagellar basal body P-ring formation protein FlgA